MQLYQINVLEPKKEPKDPSESVVEDKIELEDQIETDLKTQE